MYRENLLSSKLFCVFPAKDVSDACKREIYDEFIAYSVFYIQSLIEKLKSFVLDDEMKMKEK